MGSATDQLTLAGQNSTIIELGTSAWASWCLVHRRGAVADLQAVAAGIFEKYGVVNFILPVRTFYIPGAGTRGDPGEAIDFRNALRPKCDPVLIRYVTSRFGDAKKCGWAIICRRGFVL